MNVMLKWLSGCVLLLSLSVAQAQNVHGVLRVVKGDVQIKSAQTGAVTKAKLGQQVFPKDVILTGKDARAKIVMVDNNEINVSPESQIEIQHYEFDPNAGKKEVLLNVIYGKVRAKVEQKYDGKTSKFQVKTPAAVAGVRGTDFMTSFDRQTNNSQVITFRGRVEFGLPGPGGTILNPVSVTPGTTATSARGSAPAAPTSIPKDQLVKMDNDTRADGAAAKPDTHAPSNDGGKKDDGAKKQPDNSSNSDTRAPASAAGPSASRPTVTANDLGGSVGGPAAILQPPAPPPPPPPPPPRQPVCTTCQSLIQNGNSKVNITVHTR